MDNQPTAPSYARRSRYSRRAILGTGALVASAAAAGLGALVLRKGGGIVPGVSRARFIATDDPLPDRAEVVVVGGGNIGCLTALTLAERGVPTVLCEKGVIAGEASGRSLGFVEYTFLDAVKMELIARSKELWSNLNSRTETDTGYRRTGLAYLFTEKSGVEAADDWLSTVRGAPGFDSRLITSRECEAFAPQSTAHYVGGLLQGSDGCAEPQLAAPAAAEAVRRLKGTVAQNCAVRGIEKSGGRISAVITERGRIACQAVVLAGGVWSPLFAKSLNLELPQFNAFASMARLSPVAGPTMPMIEDDRFCIRQTIAGDYVVCKEVAVTPITPETFRNLPRLWPAYKQMSSAIEPALNLSTFWREWSTPSHWPLDRPSPFERNRILMPELRAHLLDQVIEDIRTSLPVFNGSEVVERWAGALMTTPDNMPVISAVSSIPGLFLGTGFYYGLTMAPAAGEALADLVTGRTPKINLELYRYERFTDGSAIQFRQ